VGTGLPFLLFSSAMPQRTRAGVELREWALGFEEFVERVESDQIETDRRRGVFEALLPYAMALGVAAAWARRFEGIYEREAPGWFTGPRGAHAGIATSGLESRLSGVVGQTGKVMASAPRSQGSSGSGGGGSSGGGGGGGGGGSW
jgi:hypothetical protein